MVYTLKNSLNFMKYSRVHLEIVNVMLALNIWGKISLDTHIHIHCDNLAVIQDLNSGKTKDMTLATCA